MTLDRTISTTSRFPKVLHLAALHDPSWRLLLSRPLLPFAMELELTPRILLRCRSTRLRGKTITSATSRG